MMDTFEALQDRRAREETEAQAIERATEEWDAQGDHAFDFLFDSPEYSLPIARAAIKAGTDRHDARGPEYPVRIARQGRTDNRRHGQLPNEANPSERIYAGTVARGASGIYEIRPRRDYRK